MEVSATFNCLVVTSATGELAVQKTAVFQLIIDETTIKTRHANFTSKLAVM